eukprot:1929659-Pyramimonas_sp.AAC.1
MRISSTSPSSASPSSSSLPSAALLFLAQSRRGPRLYLGVAVSSTMVTQFMCTAGARLKNFGVSGR